MPNEVDNTDSVVINLMVKQLKKGLVTPMLATIVNLMKISEKSWGCGAEIVVHKLLMVVMVLEAVYEEEWTLILPWMRLYKVLPEDKGAEEGGEG